MTTLPRPYKAGQRVMVATHFGKRRAIVVRGRATRAGNLQVQLVYDDGSYGAPRYFHVDDVSKGWSAR